ncbi:MAG: hypothetical protein ACM36C_01260 [Acidobacteriota bacterium]
MWHWLSCYLVGHDYSICCESGAIFLRCTACGHRSQGWDLHGQHAPMPHDHQVSPNGVALAPARHH